MTIVFAPSALAGISNLHDRSFPPWIARKVAQAFVLVRAFLDPSVVVARVAPPTVAVDVEPERLLIFAVVNLHRSRNR
jgi:hypothetical protein